VLTPEQIRRFHAYGYVEVEDFLNGAEVAALQAETKDYHESLRHQTPADVIVGWEPDSEGAPPCIQQILHAERLSPAIDGLLRSDHVLDEMECLLGRDIGLFETKLLMKSARFGQPIPLHQDFSYWTEYSAAPVQVSLLIRIDPADEENGCLRVVPGSHTRGLLRHAVAADGSTFGRGLPDEVDLPDPVSLPGRAGSAVLFSPLLLHGSGANQSERQRRSLTLVYTIPGVHDHHREVLRSGGEHPDLGHFFPVADIRCFTGPGPHGGQCAASYRRRELWKLAASLVDEPKDCWVELSGASSERGPFVWLAGRKPTETLLIRLDRCSGLSSNRDDVKVVPGPFDASLARADVARQLGGRLGLLHIDSPHRAVVVNALTALAPCIRPGTILVFDQFYGDRNPERRTAEALRSFLQDRRLGVEYLGRADSQVAARISDAASGPRVRCLDVPWKPTVQGIAFDLAPAEPRTEAPAAKPARRERSRWKRRIRRLREKRDRLVQGSRRLLRPSPMERFFPVERIPAFVGDGPAHGYCPTHSLRRQLWEYSLSLIEDPSLCWCEFGVGEGESLDWFASRKPSSNLLIGFDSFEGIPEPWATHPVGQWRSDVYESNRADVVIVEGMFDTSLGREDVLARLGDPLGFLHIDCDLYSSTQTVLRALDPLIQPGTVVVFDEFYGYEGWEECEAKAFREFAMESGVAFEWIARSDFQVGLRILSRGRAGVSIRKGTWQPTVAGISLSSPGVGFGTGHLE
jgi:ectoine hydroxylase-related dioxygenase (phytanoyl-CoA dioxygenase family)